MRIPCLETKRPILRSFTEDDTDALYLLLSDQEVNTFLPWFPVKNKAEANQFYKERLAASNKAEPPYSYAICFKEDPRPIGYVTVGMDDSYDFGYALRKEFWHKGLVTEASRAVVAQLMKDGLPYITATHDKNNPRSGGVMKQLGMKYQYSYEEQWQPKNIPVIFRMYQLNLDGDQTRVYRKYWDHSVVHFIEEI